MSITVPKFFKKWDTLFFILLALISYIQIIYLAVLKYYCYICNINLTSINIRNLK